MAINFPNSPTVNDTFTVGGINFTFTGVKWESGAVVELSSDTTPTLGGNLDGGAKNIHNVGVITATGFSGPLTGNVTGNATGLTGDPSIQVTNATVLGNLDVQGTTSTIDTAITQVDSLSVEGSVGIGTTNPAYQLSINGTGAVRNEIVCTDNNGAGAGVYFRTMNGGSMVSNSTIRTDNSGNLQFFIGTSSDVERLRITSGGVVGINTTTGFDTSVGLAVRNGASSSDHTMIDIIANTNETSRLVFSDDTDHAQGRLQYNHTGNSLAFYTNGNNERLRITSAGRIGIGTDDPQGLLAIQGDSNGSTTPSIRLQDGTDPRQCAITNSAGDLILFNSGSDNTPHCKITMFDGNIFSFETANTERLRIDSNGNFIFKNGALIENGFHDNGGGLTGNYIHDLATYGNVHFSSTNAAGTFTYNLRITNSVSLNSVMAEGDTLSFTLMHASNNTSYYLTQLKIDGTNVTPVWAGGSAPSAATGSGFDVYSFSIMKVGNNAYGIFGTFTNHA